MLCRFGRSTILFLALSMSAATVVGKSTEPLKVKEDAPSTYTVVKGDTLWDISALYLDSPWLWPRLWQINPDIENPHLIYPGDRITLSWRNGQPMLSLKPMVKLSPKVKVLEKRAVPTVKEGVVLPFLESDQLFVKSEVDASARVLGASQGTQYLQAKIYITGQQTHTHWAIYRVSTEFVRGEKSVVALKKLADAELESSRDAMSALTITAQTQEIRVDDIAIPQAELASFSLSTTFYPTPSPEGEFATILGSLEGGNFAAKNHVIVIDRGANDRLVQGSMFELYQPGKEVAAYHSSSKEIQQAAEQNLQLPDIKVGSLMVIRPYADFSLALITDSQQPITKKTKALAPTPSSVQ